MSEYFENMDMSYDASFGDANFSIYGTSSNPDSKMLFTPLVSSEYKVSQPPSMESQIRKLRLSMEPLREIVLRATSTLLWDHHWHPVAIVSTTTVLFMLLWLFDPNVLTVLSIIGLLITIADYSLPYVLSSLFKNTEWDDEKEKQYEEICTNVILYKTKAELLVSSYCRLRVTNPKLYFSVTIVSLYFLSWLGGVVDNLFLTYLTVTALLLLPGMQHHGMLNKFSYTFSKIFNDLVENAKAKVGQKKTQ